MIPETNKIILVPVKQKTAKEYVRKHHRHHKPPVGSIFQIGCSKNGELCGVIIVGRPVARMLDNGLTAEVTRCCTNGTKNACSMLYAAAWRPLKECPFHPKDPNTGECIVTLKP